MEDRGTRLTYDVVGVYRPAWVAAAMNQNTRGKADPTRAARKTPQRLRLYRELGSLDEARQAAQRVRLMGATDVVVVWTSRLWDEVLDNWVEAESGELSADTDTKPDVQEPTYKG